MLKKEYLFSTFSITIVDMKNIVSRIRKRIYTHKKGWVFTPGEFADITDARITGVVLGRLMVEGKIRRLNHGIYDYPKTHPKLGQLYPSLDEIANAVSKRDGIRILPSKATAANLLGLTEQVPAKSVYLTDGKGRKIKLGNQILEFRKTSPRQMALANKMSGITIQALRYIGKDQIDKTVVRRLKRTLPGKVKRELLNNIILAPAWMRPTLNEIATA